MAYYQVMLRGEGPRAPDVRAHPTRINDSLAPG